MRAEDQMAVLLQPLGEGCGRPMAFEEGLQVFQVIVGVQQAAVEVDSSGDHRRAAGAVSGLAFDGKDLAAGDVDEGGLLLPDRGHIKAELHRPFAQHAAPGPHGGPDHQFGAVAAEAGADLPVVEIKADAEPHTAEVGLEDGVSTPGVMPPSSSEWVGKFLR